MKASCWVCGSTADTKYMVAIADKDRQFRTICGTTSCADRLFELPSFRAAGGEEE